MSHVEASSGFTVIEPMWTTGGSEHLNTLAWSPDGTRLAAGYADGRIRLIDPLTGDRLWETPGHVLGALALAWSPNGRRLASGGQDGQARLWEPATGTVATVLNGGGPWVENLAWWAPEQWLATTAGRTLRLWNADGAKLFDFDVHESTITGLTWLRETPRLATSCYGGVSLWNPGQSRPERQFEWKGSFLSLALSPNDKHIAGGCQDATMIVWDVKTGEHLGMSGYPAKVSLLAWDAGSRFLASGAADKVILWDFAGPGPADREPSVLSRHVDRIVAMRTHPTQPVLATAGQDGMLIVWRLPDGRIKNLSILDSPLSALEWHPDGSSLAVGSAGGEISLFRPD